RREMAFYYSLRNSAVLCRSAVKSGFVLRLQFQEIKNLSATAKRERQGSEPKQRESRRFWNSQQFDGYIPEIYAVVGRVNCAHRAKSRRVEMEGKHAKSRGAGAGIGG